MTETDTAERSGVSELKADTGPNDKVRLKVYLKHEAYLVPMTKRSRWGTRIGTVTIYTEMACRGSNATGQE